MTIPNAEKDVLTEQEVSHILDCEPSTIQEKARRGELRIPLPVGLIYDMQGRVILDPDKQVQQALDEHVPCLVINNVVQAAFSRVYKKGLIKVEKLPRNNARPILRFYK